MDAKNITKFLDKISIGIDTENELFLEVKDKQMNTGLMNEPQTFFVYGSYDIELPDMQIPVSKFSNMQDSMSTFSKKVQFKIEDKRLLLKGKNIKKVPLCRWKDVGTRIINKIEKVTEGVLPISLKKSEYDIAVQDKEKSFAKVTEVFFVVKDKVLDIQIKDESGFESLTQIPDVDLADGEYILPTVVFDIMKKSDNLEIAFTSDGDVPLAFFRETGNNFMIKYLVTGMSE